MLTVIAKITAKRTQINEAKALLQSLVAPTHQEDGCIAYDLHQGTTEDHVFFFYETWKDREALEQHLANTHLVDFRKQADSLLQKPMEVFLLNKLAE